VVADATPLITITANNICLNIPEPSRCSGEDNPSANDVKLKLTTKCAEKQERYGSGSPLQFAEKLEIRIRARL
jgi:hypothetical protein